MVRYTTGAPRYGAPSSSTRLPANPPSASNDWRIRSGEKDGSNLPIPDLAADPPFPSNSTGNIVGNRTFIFFGERTQWAMRPATTAASLLPRFRQPHTSIVVDHGSIDRSDDISL
ncbi:hypothetical protein ACLOJK_037562 [Asimina triloba]